MRFLALRNLAVAALLALTTACSSPPSANARVVDDEYSNNWAADTIEAIVRKDGYLQRNWTEEDYERCRPTIREFAEHRHHIDWGYVFAQPGHQMDRCFDIHTTRYSGKEYSDFRDDSDGHLRGIGIEITRECYEFPPIDIECSVYVVRALLKTPARAAGFKADDRLYSVASPDGPVYIRSLSQAVDLIRGTPGTSVTVTIQRGGETLDLTATRADVELHTVELSHPENVCVVRMKSFGEHTVDEWVNALTLCPSPFTILDLRNNPGGLLSSAIGVLFSMTKDPHRTLVRSVFKTYENHWTLGAAERFCRTNPSQYNCRGLFDRHTGEMHRAGSQAGRTFIILENGKTASAAEIVAGACQSWAQNGKRRRAGEGDCTLRGTPSYGKVHIQTIFPFPNPRVNGAWKMTSGEFIPGDREASLPGTSIEPDVLVEDTRRRLTDGPENDAVLRSALDYVHALEAQAAAAGTGPRS